MELFFPLTGKSLSEALIFASTNQQYDDRLFQAQTWGELVVYRNFFDDVTRKIGPLDFNSMNNLSSYCWLVDAKIRASDKDLPVIDQIDLKLGSVKLTRDIDHK